MDEWWAAALSLRSLLLPFPLISSIFSLLSVFPSDPFSQLSSRELPGTRAAQPGRGGGGGGGGPHLRAAGRAAAADSEPAAAKIGHPHRRALLAVAGPLGAALAGAILAAHPPPARRLAQPDLRRCLDYAATCEVEDMHLHLDGTARKGSRGGGGGAHSRPRHAHRALPRREPPARAPVSAGAQPIFIFFIFRYEC